MRGSRRISTSSGAITKEDTTNYKGYLNALRSRRAYFKANGATATDHGHLTALTADLSAAEATKLYATIYTGKATVRTRLSSSRRRC